MLLHPLEHLQSLLLHRLHLGFDGRVVVTREKKREPARGWSRAPIRTAQPRSVAIVGAGAAGTCAAQELRRLGVEVRTETMVTAIRPGSVAAAEDQRV